MSDTVMTEGAASAAPTAPTQTSGVVNSQQTSTQSQPTTTSAVGEPWYKEWIQSDSSLNNKALEKLPDHLKGLSDTLGRQKNLEGVLMNLDHLQKVAGKKALSPLPPNAPPEVVAERKSVLDAIMGVPKDPKEYGIAKPKDLPDAAWNQQLAETFTQWAHKNSVSPAAARELVDLQIKGVQGQIQQQQAYEQQFWASEQKTFEATINRENISAERASALVEKGALALGMDLSNEKTKNFLKGADARLMAMRHALAIGEDRIVTGQDTTGEARDPMALAEDARKNPSNPLYGAYWNKEGKFSRTDHDAAVAKVNGWLQMAAGKEAGRARR